MGLDHQHPQSPGEKEKSRELGLGSPICPLAPPMPTCANPSPSLQYDDQQPVVLRRRSSSDLARQKFGTMPLLPIRGDDSGATLLSANQTLVRSQPTSAPSSSPPVPLPHCRRERCTCQLGVLPLSSVCPLSTFYCQASLCLCVFLSPNPHPPVPRGDFTIGGPCPCSL